MSTMMPTFKAATQQPGERREWPHSLQQRANHTGISPGLLALGLAALGLGALAAYYFGPDLARYIKIERM